MAGRGMRRCFVYVLYLYRQAFTFHNMGYASALGVDFVCAGACADWHRDPQQPAMGVL